MLFHKVYKFMHFELFKKKLNYVLFQSLEGEKETKTRQKIANK